MKFKTFTAFVCGVLMLTSSLCLASSTLEAGKVIVEGINKVKRHSKPSLKVPQGGIITKEMPLHACKVQLVCPACNKPTKIAHKNVDGKNLRVCKKCGEVVDSAK